MRCSSSGPSPAESRLPEASRHTRHHQIPARASITSARCRNARVAAARGGRYYSSAGDETHNRDLAIGLLLIAGKVRTLTRDPLPRCPQASPPSVRGVTAIVRPSNSISTLSGCAARLYSHAGCAAAPLRDATTSRWPECRNTRSELRGVEFCRSRRGPHRSHRSPTTGGGLTQGGLDDNLLERRGRAGGEIESGVGHQGRVLGDAALLTARADEHVEVAELGLRTLVGAPEVSLEGATASTRRSPRPRGSTRTIRETLVDPLQPQSSLMSSSVRFGRSRSCCAVDGSNQRERRP
jgi:hypothetical protein